MTTAKDAFSSRRPLDPPVGVPSDFRDSPVEDATLAKLAASPRLRDSLERDRMPIPSTRDREGYFGDRHFEYWLSGLHDYTVLKEALPNLRWRGARVLDFGGATGRVARHLYAHEDDLSEITIADLNVNNVAWVLDNFPSDVGAFKNSPLPMLPVPDAHLDLVIAFSVFTHMDEYELAWLYELRRVLKPGGILYATVHNDDTWRILPSTYVFSVLRYSERFQAIYREAPDLPGRLVFDYSAESAYNCNTFHPNTYLYRVWGRVLTVVDIVATAHGYQSAVVLRNDAGSRRATGALPTAAPTAHGEAVAGADGRVGAEHPPFPAIEEQFLTRLIEKTRNFSGVTWLGQPTWQNVLDLWTVQETLCELRPALLVECGTNRGGSSLFFATLFDLMGHGHVVTIDIEKKHDLAHPRVSYLLGDSVAPGIVAQVAAAVETASGPVLVLLDSDHREAHVRRELDLYHRFVTPGSFLIVQDGIIDAHPMFAAARPGPLPAIEAFLAAHPEFEVDAERCTRFLITHSPRGWLRRKH